MCWLLTHARHSPYGLHRGLPSHLERNNKEVQSWAAHLSSFVLLCFLLSLPPPPKRTLHSASGMCMRGIHISATLPAKVCAPCQLHSLLTTLMTGWGCPQCSWRMLSGWSMWQGKEGVGRWDEGWEGVWGRASPRYPSWESMCVREAPWWNHSAGIEADERWRSSSRQWARLTTPTTPTPHPTSGVGAPPGDSCNGGWRGWISLETRQEQQVVGWGWRAWDRKKCLLKKKRPRDGKIFMGSLGPISFSFCPFILVINIYLIKKHSPAPPQRDSFKTLPIMITQIRAVD